MTEQLTFTEQEAKEHAEFINFVYSNGKWDLTSKEVLRLAKLFNVMHLLQKKVDAHIMEVTNVITPRKPKKKAK